MQHFPQCSHKDSFQFNRPRLTTISSHWLCSVFCHVHRNGILAIIVAYRDRRVYIILTPSQCPVETAQNQSIRILFSEIWMRRRKASLSTTGCLRCLSRMGRWTTKSVVLRLLCLQFPPKVISWEVERVLLRKVLWNSRPPEDLGDMMRDSSGDVTGCMLGWLERLVFKRIRSY